MSLGEMISTKGAELAGKLGISSLVISEAGKSQGIFESVTLIQIISTCGVLWLMVDRTINSVMSARTRNGKVIIGSLWGFMWAAFITFIWVVI